MDERHRAGGVRDEIPGERGKNVSTIGARGPGGVLTGVSVSGSIDGDTRLYFIEEMVAPLLKPGQIILMANGSVHEQEEIEDAVEARGAQVIFLPPYAPELNPIENCWSKVTSILRSIKPRSLPDLLDALVEAFSSISISDIRGWFKHCGYQVAHK